MKDVNSKDYERKQREEFNKLCISMEVLRKNAEFQAFLEQVGRLREATMERAMEAKPEHLQTLQTYFHLLTDFLEIANVTDPNTGQTDEESA